MPLRARLRRRLAAEARRLAGVLLRAADEVEPDDEPASDHDPPVGVEGGPPEAWLAVVRARAPQLLEGRGIGVSARSGRPTGALRGPEPRPEPAVTSDPSEADEPWWPDLPPAESAASARWPEGQPTARHSPRWPSLESAEPSPANWPATVSPAEPDHPRRADRRPDDGPIGAVTGEWPSGSPADVRASKRALALRAGVGRTAAARWTAHPGTPVVAAGRWAAPPTEAPPEPTWPAPLAPHAPLQPYPSVPAVTSRPERARSDCKFDDAVVDEVVTAPWPALPDGDEQHEPADLLDRIEADRVRRLDAEQRGV